MTFVTAIVEQKGFDWITEFRPIVRLSRPWPVGGVPSVGVFLRGRVYAVKHQNLFEIQLRNLTNVLANAFVKFYKWRINPIKAILYTNHVF